MARQPLPDMLLDLRLELVGAVEALVGRSEMPRVGAEPAGPEMLQRLELSALDLDLLGVQEHPCGLAIDQHIRRSPGAGRLHGVFELVFRTGRRRAIRAAVIRRQLKSEPLPKYADHQIGLGRQRDLVLEGLGGRVVRALPAYRLQQSAAELAIQPRDHPLHPLALGEHVRGRRNENAKTPVDHGSAISLL